jgi:ATP-binding cassette subfamily B multidrug efflux pump
MLKLIKHLRPFAWQIAAIFILLFAQAMSDLSLPAYMSDIVNIGIQQGGIENAVPQAMRAGEFSKVLVLMSGDEKTRVSGDYTLLDRQQLPADEYAKDVDTYPQLADTPIYRLNTDNKTEISQLDVIFSRYLPAVLTIEKGGAALFSGTPVQIPAGADPFAVMAALPADQLSALRSMLQAQLASASPGLLKQYSIGYISAEYKAIGMDMGKVQTAYMLRIGLLMLLLTLFSVLCSITVGFLSARVAAGLGRDLRRRLFVRVESFSSTEFDRFSTASLITRSTNDITQIQMLMVMLFRVAFYAPIIAIGALIRVIGADRAMLGIIAAAVGVMVVMIAVIFSIAVPRFKRIQKLADRLNLVTREMLSGLMVIRAFNRQRHEEGRFDTANLDLTRTNLFVNRIMVFMMPVMMLLMNGVMLLIIWIGAHQVDLGTTQVGDLMAFMQYAIQIIFSFLMVSFMFIMVPRASVSANRISEVLETDPVIKDAARPRQFDSGAKGLLEFQNVSFRYPGAEDDVLSDITFTARPGQVTAFIGSTGSGKSTLASLVPRFYDVSGGRVLVDGLDVRDVTQHDLRQRIGFVSQNAVLFSGSIKSNIKYADENATDEEIARCAETAQALDFINTAELGYDTAVSQGGSNLSGGQKQRLSIARALAAKAEIYIFDDSFSALDFKTDAALRKALRKETGSATVLIMTQRLSTIMTADQIVVLENGRIAGIGSHGQLMQSCGVYREIALSQLSREELA